MPSIHDSMMTVSATPLHQHYLGVAVTLRSGDQETESFTARRLDEFDVIGDNVGVPVKIKYRNYMLPVASLVFGDIAFTPRKGMKIIDGSEVYALVSLMTGPDVELQPAGYEILVHTQKVV